MTRLSKTPRTLPWPDKLAIRTGVVLFVVLLAGSALMILMAGSAPLGRLSQYLLTWSAMIEVLVTGGVWVGANLIRLGLTAARSVRRNVELAPIPLSGPYGNKALLRR